MKVSKLHTLWVSILRIFLVKSSRKCLFYSELRPAITMAFMHIRTHPILGDDVVWRHAVREAGGELGVQADKWGKSAGRQRDAARGVQACHHDGGVHAHQGQSQCLLCYPLRDKTHG